MHVWAVLQVPTCPGPGQLGLVCGLCRVQSLIFFYHKVCMEKDSNPDATTIGNYTIQSHTALHTSSSPEVLIILV